LKRHGRVIGHFTGCGVPPKFYEEFKHKGIAMPLETFWTKEQRERGSVSRR